MIIEDINTYFKAEKVESLIFIITGIIALTIAVFFLSVIKYKLYVGIAIPLLIIALIQIIVGSTIYLRSNKDCSRVENYVNTHPKSITDNEIPRMTTVIKSFKIYKWIEIVLIAISLLLIILYAKSTTNFWLGVGIGLLIQSSIMLTLDIVAEKRGNVYKQALEQFMVTSQL